MDRNSAEKVGVAFQTKGIISQSTVELGKQSMSRQALQSWLKTGFCRGGRGGGAKAGETVWDLIGWDLEGQAEAGRNGTPLTIFENEGEL